MRLHKPKKNDSRIEGEPWRCRFCKSKAIRFANPLGLRCHIIKQHKLAAKFDISDFETQSARKRKRLSEKVKDEWSDMKQDASKAKPETKTPARQKRDACETHGRSRD